MIFNSERCCDHLVKVIECKEINHADSFEKDVSKQENERSLKVIKHIIHQTNMLHEYLRLSHKSAVTIFFKYRDKESHLKRAV